ncbi:hypothetical protein FPCIR_3273 [Fusarium pseudocircinatum]|uniref:Uncharacterized protein n=1 Tax=Fusarium pseudocircinatum TaxID=56676 RepID=A0A8H5PL38_9HYPO|nr:hypothetical protein FPCIR_3273 [Fusarium pseudocircinatum]
MKFITLISAFATAGLVSADQRAQLHSPGGSVRRLSARDSTCPRPMCQTPASQGPNDPPACGDSYASCKFDQFPCDDYMTPKVTDTHHCYCILANKQAMDAYCQERGFKSGRNPWKYYYAVECHGAANDQVCNKDCHDQGRGHGRIDKAHPNGACACDKPNPPYDTCKQS